MKKLVLLAAIASIAAIVFVGTALADAPAPTTFIAVLDPDEEVPACTTATNATRGVAIFHVTDEATGTVEYKVVANNVPGSLTAGHIHIAPEGVAGPVVQPLNVVPGADNGIVAEGSFSNPALLAALRANPGGYYVNLHSGPPGVGCPAGTLRGQLDDHGPSNN